ncbi:glycosyltransferase [Paenibacillus thermotolerans]|uniref:glycosyltransferase n=1 Tax=Paenibacillus thermotolerans TaxID=3027807 RepID=UPI002367D9DA|nr:MULTISPECIES: glycosyltransferase [unclassified Paenibacillus]
MPHGTDTQFYNPENEKFPLRGSTGKFIFVSVFGFQHRKNPEGLLRAYWEEFKPDEQVMLLMKTHWYGNKNMGHQIRKSISQFREKLGIGRVTAPLVLITNILDSKQLRGVYTLGNAFVLPSRGEGVGLPFIEALSSGIPVIATGWGGQTDFLHEGNSFLVNYELENPGTRMNHSISPDYRIFFSEKDQQWAEPDLEHLKKQMRYAYENPDLCRKKGMQGRRDMLNYTWDRGGIELKQAVEKMMG